MDKQSWNRSKRRQKKETDGITCITCITSLNNKFSPHTCTCTHTVTRTV